MTTAVDAGRSTTSRRAVWWWARLAAAAGTLAVLVWQPGHEPIPRRRAGGRRRGAGGCLRPRRADHGVLRLALEDRGPRPRHRPAAGYGGGRLLPLAVPQCHAARRGGGRRPPRDQPRPRHQRRRPRAARRGVGALGGAGRAGRRHRRRAPRRAVAGAGDHAARRARTARGGSRRRAGGARAARRRPITVGAVAQRRGPRAARRTARPAGVARHRARVGAGRGGPCSDVPDRRENRGGDRAAVPDACRWRCSCCWPGRCPTSAAGGRARA